MTLRRPDLTSWLGASVVVTVDRPLGNRHPNHPELVYPVNYGHVAGATGGDGEPIDAYVLGVAGSVPAASGIVVALVQRADDAEDKLVVAPPGCCFSRTHIERLLAFQERFFASRVVLWREEGGG